MSFIGSNSFGFAQNTILDFQKYSIELMVALSLTNATKTDAANNNVAKDYTSTMK